MGSEITICFNSEEICLKLSEPGFVRMETVKFCFLEAESLVYETSEGKVKGLEIFNGKIQLVPGITRYIVRVRKGT